MATQALVRLGADPNRLRQQVIQLLHGYQGREPVSWGRPGRAAARTVPSDVRARVNALE